MKYLFLLILFLSNVCLSKVVTYQITNKRFIQKDLKQACLDQKISEHTVVAPLSLTQLDCNGITIDIVKSCFLGTDHNFSKTLLRGYISKNSKVVCEYGDDVVLEIKCIGVYKNLCNKKNACKEIKKSYAYSLDLLNQVVTTNISGNTLKCIFSKNDISFSNF